MAAQITIQSALIDAQQQLGATVESPVLDAEILLAHTLEKPRSYLRAHAEQVLTDAQLQTFSDYVQRRCNKEPIAYITGTKEFWSLEFFVSRDTLIPRPETELLVEAVLKIFSSDLCIKLADLGTGSGAIAIAIAHERPAWKIVATDISDKALQIASKNAQKFTANNISFSQGNWFTAFPSSESDDRFDVIVSNPPYIAEDEWETYAEGLAHEPRRALVSGGDGLDAIREICRTAKNYLKPGGYLFIEHGFLQGAVVREIFTVAGFSAVYTISDLSGNERVTVGCS